jgi:hypothetical protein
MRNGGEAGPAGRPPWTLLTSHGLTLLYISTHRDATIREIAAALMLTERRVADIIQDLASEELVAVQRRGRRNQYTVSVDANFRHPLIADVPFDGLVKLWRERLAPTPPGHAAGVLVSSIFSSAAPFLL